MKNILLIFCFVANASIYTSCAKKNEKIKTDPIAYYPDKIILQGRYGENGKNTARGKQLIKKKARTKDKAIDNKSYVFSEWVNNVGEAMDMMK